MFHSDKKKVRDLLIATRFGVSASEMKTIIGVEQNRAMKSILQLKEEGEDIRTLGEGTNPEELGSYSIGEIEP